MPNDSLLNNELLDIITTFGEVLAPASRQNLCLFTAKRDQDLEPAVTPEKQTISSAIVSRFVPGLLMTLEVGWRPKLSELVHGRQ